MRAAVLPHESAIRIDDANVVVAVHAVDLLEASQERAQTVLQKRCWIGHGKHDCRSRAPRARAVEPDDYELSPCASSSRGERSHPAPWCVDLFGSSAG